MKDMSLLSVTFRPLAAEVIRRLENDPLWIDKGYRPIVLETLRDLSVQMAYYSRSRMAVDDVKKMFSAAKLWNISDTEAKVASTWTLESKHIQGMAIDIAPSKDGKTPDWNADVAVWAKLGYYSREIGLSWGGDWKTKDSPHVEMGR